MIHALYTLKHDDGHREARYLKLRGAANLYISEHGFKVESLNICKSEKEAIELRDYRQKQFDEEYAPTELRSAISALCGIIRGIKATHKIAAKNTENAAECSFEYLRYEDLLGMAAIDLDSAYENLCDAKYYLEESRGEEKC